jgi:hypothetical protein
MRDFCSQKGDEGGTFVGTKGAGDENWPSTIYSKRSDPFWNKDFGLCRFMAGPTITHILAEYGAEVLKITSQKLSDVPFFRVDGNVGKQTAD